MRALRWLKGQPVLLVAALAALLSMLTVPPSPAYAAYFDWHTLLCLFSMLAVLNGLRQLGAFRILAAGLVRRFASLRAVVLVLVMVTFFGSMFLTNDMALLTFLPLGFFVLETTGKRKYMAYTFVLQNIAANLGGLITPFGNPQNLYLYSYYHIDTFEFIKIMFLPFFTALILITLCCVLVPKEAMTLQQKEPYAFHEKRTILYSILFLISILAVLRLIPYQAATLVVTAAMIFLDKKALRDVNYALLATFAVFFVFSGNMARIEPIQELFSRIIPGRTLLLGLGCCQFFSNVPTAVMLSHFTTDYSDLLVAVNIGGLGTPIASLASLITLSEYRRHDKEHLGKYILIFLGLNLLFLMVLTLIQMLSRML